MESSYIVELYNKNMYNPRLSPKKSWAANSIQTGLGVCGTGGKSALFVYVNGGQVIIKT